MIINKKLNQVVTELFIRSRKISIVFITPSHFKLPKEVKINTTYFFMKFQIKENFNKLHITIHQISTLKILGRFIKNIRFFS